VSSPEPARVSAFGLDITSHLALPGRWRFTGAGLPPLAIEPATREDIRARWSGFERVGWRGRADGRGLVVEEGRARDLRLRLEPAIELHLSADGTRLAVSHPADDRLAALRVLLDSALFTASLRHGFEALHAAAVTEAGAVMAVLGPTGAGKSSVLVSLLAAGCGFHADDVLVLRTADGSILASPGPPVLTAPNPVRAGIGEPIADLGDESWLGVVGADAELPLAGMLWLDDDPPGTAEWAWLLAQLLRYPRTREREGARFELAAALASAVPVLRLPARSASPDALAADALRWLRSLGG
jgi:hypothetical protein